jgi:hypothetical protein
MADNKQDLTEDRLWEHYGRCLDEYRFQVNLNWSRSQYFFVLNVAILAAGIGLLSAERVPAGVPIVVFLVGGASALVSIFASTVQHDYYKNVRDRKKELEDRLRLGGLALRTTTGMGGVRARIARVTTFQKAILVALIVADATGFVAAVGHATRSSPAPKVELVARVAVGHRHWPHTVPLVLSQSGRIEATATPRPGEMITLRLRSGRYEVSALASRLCTSTVSVTGSPLQSLVIRCR